tara:strand:- start:279 stop:749 length:471 start_codon:yes stop_codon:yes gene_type:complete
MSIFDKLENLNVSGDTIVSLSYSDGVNVFVHNESEVDTALSETDVVTQFAELISTPGLAAETAYGNNIIESLRDEGHLDDYERDGTFSEYLSEMIVNNFYDVDLVEYSIEKFDHKRGYCTLTADVRVSYDNLMKSAPFLHGWNVSVPTENGTLTLS